MQSQLTARPGKPCQITFSLCTEVSLGKKKKIYFSFSFGHETQPWHLYKSLFFFFTSFWKSNVPHGIWRKRSLLLHQNSIYSCPCCSQTCTSKYIAFKPPLQEQSCPVQCIKIILPFSFYLISSVAISIENLQKKSSTPCCLQQKHSYYADF